LEDYPFTPGNRLFRNDGNGHFSDVTQAAGLAEGWQSSAGLFADFDNDGDLDIFLLNVGFCVRGLRPYSLFSNRGDGTFSEESAGAGLRRAFLGTRATAVAGDYDGDGRIDLFVTSGFGPLSLSLK